MADADTQDNNKHTRKPVQQPPNQSEPRTCLFPMGNTFQPAAVDESALQRMSAYELLDLGRKLQARRPVDEELVQRVRRVYAQKRKSVPVVNVISNFERSGKGGGY